MSFSIAETVSAIGEHLAYGAHAIKDVTVKWGGHVITAVHTVVRGPVAGQISSAWSSASPYVGPYWVQLTVSVGAIAGSMFISHKLFCWGEESVDEKNKAFRAQNLPETATYTNTDRIVQLAGLVAAIGTGVLTAGVAMVAAPALGAGAYLVGGAATVLTLLL